MHKAIDKDTAMYKDDEVGGLVDAGVWKKYEIFRNTLPDHIPLSTRDFAGAKRFKKFG